MKSFTKQHRIVQEFKRCLSLIEEFELSLDANFKRADRLRQAVLFITLTERLLDKNCPELNNLQGR